MKISVIIPTLNEEESIAQTLQKLEIHNPYEIVVVDAGSKDKTCEIAKKRATVITSKQGRGTQMNTGADYATGEVLLFLHADTTLPEQGLEKIATSITQGHTCGRFRDSFDLSHPLLKFYAFFTRFQFFSYGDQGFFVTQKLFRELKGFCENAPFEDIEFYRRLLRCERPVILQEAVITSARRFKKVGIIKQAAIDFLFIVLYQLHLISLLKFFKKKWYPDIR